jgi:hypothetical protein
MTLDAPSASATTAVVKARNASITATVPVARRAPSKKAVDRDFQRQICRVIEIATSSTCNGNRDSRQIRPLGELACQLARKRLFRTLYSVRYTDRVNGSQGATVKPEAMLRACQRPGCKHSATKHGPLFAIDGQFFDADPERGVSAGFRLYCPRCAVKILEAINRLDGGARNWNG